MLKHLFLQCHPRKKQFSTDLAHRWYVRFLKYLFCLATLASLLIRIYRLVILNASIKIKIPICYPYTFPIEVAGRYWSIH